MESKENRLNFVDSALRLSKLENLKICRNRSGHWRKKRTLTRNWKLSNFFDAKRWHRKKIFDTTSIINYETEFEGFKLKSSTKFEKLWDVEKVDFVRRQIWAEKYRRNKKQKSSVASLYSDKTQICVCRRFVFAEDPYGDKNLNHQGNSRICQTCVATSYRTEIVTGAIKIKKKHPIEIHESSESQKFEEFFEKVAIKKQPFLPQNLLSNIQWIFMLD